MFHAWFLRVPNGFDHGIQDQQCVHWLLVPLLWIYKWIVAINHCQGHPSSARTDGATDVTACYCPTLPPPLPLTHIKQTWQATSHRPKRHHNVTFLDFRGGCVCVWGGHNHLSASCSLFCLLIDSWGAVTVQSRGHWLINQNTVKLSFTCLGFVLNDRSKCGHKLKWLSGGIMHCGPKPAARWLRDESVW